MVYLSLCRPVHFICPNFTLLPDNLSLVPPLVSFLQASTLKSLNSSFPAHLNLRRLIEFHHHSSVLPLRVLWNKTLANLSISQCVFLPDSNLPKSLLYLWSLELIEIHLQITVTFPILTTFPISSSDLFSTVLKIIFDPYLTLIISNLHAESTTPPKFGSSLSLTT